MNTLTNTAPAKQPIPARIVTNAKGDMLAQVSTGWGENISIARAVKVDGRWRVRALLGGHEEIVDSDAAATFTLLEDLHEAFPVDTLETSVLTGATV